MYKIIFEKRVLKDIKNIPQDDKNKIILVIHKLAANPFPQNSIPLKGRSGFRLRTGNYRIIYSINNDELIILIVKVGHRKDIYK